MIALLTSIGVIFNQLSKSSDNGSPVPIPIQKGVAFPIYYPDPARLPAGFILDQNSFNRNGQVVVYSIDYDDKKIAFTIQAKPSEDEIKTFYTNQLPLRNETKTEAGTAMIGILNNQTFASLTTSDQAWLIITAPLDINQEQFKQVLHSIKR